MMIDGSAVRSPYFMALVAAWMSVRHNRSDDGERDTLPLPNSGTRISAARTALCKKIEMPSARRFTRRSRVRCSASPSTRHPLKDPRLSLGLTSETLRGSGDITHLHNFFCEYPPLCGPTERNYRKFCGAD